MISKQNPNRGICSGDTGGHSLPHTTKKQKAKETENSISAVMVRMEPWSSDFLRKVMKENNSYVWREAAERSLRARGEKVKSAKKHKKKFPISIKRAWHHAHMSLNSQAAERRWGIR